MRPVAVLCVIVAAIVLMACPPVPIWQSGGSSTTCDAACTNAARLTCPEGKALDCAVSFTSWDQGPVRIRRPDTGVALTCAAVAGATTVAQIRAMGVTCALPQDAGASE
jgi:hypothetical protein